MQKSRAAYYIRQVQGGGGVLGDLNSKNEHQVINFKIAFPLEQRLIDLQKTVEIAFILPRIAAESDRSFLLDREDSLWDICNIFGVERMNAAVGNYGQGALYTKSAA